MRQTRLLMGMPITVLIDNTASEDIDAVFDFFQDVDKRFSTYKENSEISKFNRREIQPQDLSEDMQLILQLSEKTKQETQGFFDIYTKNGTIDPSGMVKGWAIWQAAQLLKKKGHKNFYVEAGGDVQVSGQNEKGEKWKIGIKNPFKNTEIVKIVGLTDEGIATSGTYLRGQHVYNPHEPQKDLTEIVSLTVIGKNVLEADRFATASFAMQRQGIFFLEKQKNLEGYMIDKNGIATMTTGFEKLTEKV